MQQCSSAAVQQCSSAAVQQCSSAAVQQCPPRGPNQTNTENTCTLTRTPIQTPDAAYYSYLPGPLFSDRSDEGTR